MAKNTNPEEVNIVPQDTIEGKILFVRGKKVLLDRDLAQLYGVKSIRLREQVKRNIKRFPEDFMFRLTPQEAKMMVSQNAIPSQKYLGGHLPYVFTEQGVAMLSSVLNNTRAIQVNIEIMRTFASLRKMSLTYKDLKQKIETMEKKYDGQFKNVFTVLKKLVEPSPKNPKRRIGFHHD
ncbi:MAG: ORF6N domain-containing protein [Candidatus Tantalella remota]|nr:ORF6N domain-containing protein [Candidatus Tantalella remota]